MPIKLLFADTTGLWALDEATGIATELLTLDNPTGIGGAVVAGGVGYFWLQSGGAGRTDGTAAGTSLIAALPDGLGAGTGPINFIAALSNGKAAVFYSNNATATGYLSDGTAAGTVPIAGYNGTATDAGAIGAIEFNGALLFHDGSSGVWTVNETTGAATLLQAGTAISAGGGWMVTAHGRVWFQLNAPTAGTPATIFPTQLWSTDGTVSGTTLALILPDSSGGISAMAGLANGKVALATASAGLSLTDGTIAGTMPVSGYPAGVNNIGPGYSGQLNSHLLFLDAASGLWAVDEPTATAVNLLGADSGLFFSNVAVAGGTAFFPARAAGAAGTTDTQLWRTDGTHGGTTLVTTLPDNTPAGATIDTAGIYQISPLLNGRIAFQYNNGLSTTAWISDGTATGTVPVSGYTGTFPVFGDALQGPGGAVAFSSPELVTACFAMGTRIATPDGPVAVEALRPGMAVLTASGEARPVRWIGFRGIDLQRHADRALVEPIRIRRDAMALGQPCRDLFVSPDHALFLNGALVPARLLANGASIVRDTAVRRVVYYHVELDSHDILLAENLPAESYLDTGNRAMFANGGGPARLHPDFGEGQAAREAGSCAQFLAVPEAVEPIWRGLADRAAAIGLALPAPVEMTHEPDLHVLAGTRRLNPITREGGHYLFAIPAGSVCLALGSRAARPGKARPWVEDRRRLGVRVRRLSWRANGGPHDLALDDPALAMGWWGVELDGAGPCRWTDGHAVLPFKGAGVLRVELAETARYPVEGGGQGGGHAVERFGLWRGAA